MRGTNSGPFAGLPPTGRTVCVRGADFIRVGEDGIRSVEGYFNSGDVPTQLGLQVVVQPNEIGPFMFGTSTRVGADVVGEPGAFSITSLKPRSADDMQHVEEIARQVASQMQDLDGFMGWVGATVGDRMLTITAWASPEQSKQVMRLAPHTEGARGFFGTELADGGWVSVWTPEHIGTLWARCRECGAMVDTGADSGQCGCGAALPQARPHW